MDKALFGALWDTGPWQRLEECVRGGQMPCSAFGVSENRASHLIPALMARTGRPVIVIVNSDIRAMRLAEDISAMTGAECPVFPPRPSMIRKVAAASRDILARRLSVLASALQGKAPAVVATAEALAFPLAPPKAFREGMLTVKAGQTLDLKDLAAKLSMAGYTREERAEGPGQFAVRGGLLDVFPQGAELPARLEFYGDEVEMIRLFDPWTQRSEGEVKALDIFPATEVPLRQDALERGAEAMRRALEMTKAELEKKLKSGEKKGPGGYGMASPPAERLAGAVEEYIEKLLTGGTYEGIENHLPFYYEQAAMLWDFFADPLVVLDGAEPRAGSAGGVAQGIRRRVRRGGAFRRSVLDTGAARRRLGRLRLTFAARKASYRMQDMTRDSGLKPKETVEFTGHDGTGYRGKFEMLADGPAGAGAGTAGACSCWPGRTSARSAWPTRLWTWACRPCTPRWTGTFRPARSSCSRPACGRVMRTRRRSSRCSARRMYSALRGRSKTVVQRSSKRKMDLFADLQVGDFVVHETHGIGVFRGVVKLTADGQTRDYMDIEYRGSDRLYVPTELMDRVEKYIGAEGSRAQGEPPGRRGVGAREEQGAREGRRHGGGAHQALRRPRGRQGLPSMRRTTTCRGSSRKPSPMRRRPTRRAPSRTSSAIWRAAASWTGSCAATWATARRKSRCGRRSRP